MNKVTYVLHLEDDNNDVELVQAMLEVADIACQITRVQTGDEYREALHEKRFDVILADYRLPGYDGVSALRLAQELCSDVPFIFVSGTMGEDAAIEGLTQGATDYVLKNKLARLTSAVKRALHDAENKRERKQAEETLRESEARFRAVANSANDGIVSTDSQGIIFYWNKAAHAMFGYTDEEILGQSLTILIPERYQEKYQDVLKHCLTNYENRPLSRTVEAVGRKKDNSEFPIELSVGSWDTRAGTFFTGIVRNITERKQAAERLHLQSTALEAAANGILITGRDGTILWCNPEFTRLTGYSAEEVLGQNPRILKSGKQPTARYQDLWNTILAGQVWHGELINQRKDGSQYAEEMTIAPVRQEQGEISHFIAIKQDISERKQHELESQAIITISNALRTAPTRAEMLPVLLDQMNDLFHSDGAMLAMQNPVSGATILELGRGIVGSKFTGMRLAPGQGLSEQLLTSDKPYRNNDVRNGASSAHSDILGNARAVAYAPLIAQEQPIGALWIIRQNDISESELRLLTAVADIAANAIHRATLHEQTERQVHRLIALHQIDIAISTNFDLGITLDVILNNVKDELEVGAASILLLTPFSQTLDYVAGVGFRTRDIERSHVKLGDGSTGRAALGYQTVACPDISRGQETFSRSTLLAGEEFASHFVAPLIVKGQVKGVLEVFHRKPFEPGQEWLNYFETLATQAAIAIESASLFENLQHSNTELVQAYDATIEGWSHALDLRDKETEGHTLRVTEMAMRLAEKMGMNDTEKLNLRRGALLHDIGKMGVPDTILLKPGELTDDEWKIMRQHPAYAYEMLSPIGYLKQALDISYCHHEKWDGSGYPRGLKGEDIPLAARVFAVVDVFDALTSDRPYRRAWPREKVYAYIREQSGKYFDPQVVTAFLQI